MLNTKETLIKKPKSVVKVFKLNFLQSYVKNITSTISEKLLIWI